jgi:hypothetical protein
LDLSFDRLLIMIIYINMRAVIIVEDPTFTIAAVKTLKLPRNIVCCDTNCE